jgi:hypothetical protein
MPWYFETQTEERLDLLPMFSSELKFESGSILNNFGESSIGQGIILFKKSHATLFKEQATYSNILFKEKRYKLKFVNSQVGGTIIKWSCGAYSQYHKSMANFVIPTKEFIVKKSSNWWSYANVVTCSDTLDNFDNTRTNIYINRSVYRRLELGGV